MLDDDRMNKKNFSPIKTTHSNRQTNESKTETIIIIIGQPNDSYYIHMNCWIHQLPSSSSFVECVNKKNCYERKKKEKVHSISFEWIWLILVYWYGGEGGGVQWFVSNEHQFQTNEDKFFFYIHWTWLFGNSVV